MVGGVDMGGGGQEKGRGGDIPPMEAVMWAPIAPPSALVAAKATRPVAGSPVDRNAAAAATLPAAKVRLMAFLPGKFVGLLGKTPCNFPNATAEPADVFTAVSQLCHQTHTSLTN